MLSTRVWLVLPDSITLQWGSLIDTSSPLQSVGAPAIDRVWALPPCSTLGCSLSLSKFGRSCHRVWALSPSLGALRWWWPVFKCTCVLGCQYYQTLWVLCSASGSDTRAWFSRNGFRHSWGRVLRHFSTSLAITEWGLGVYSWFVTSCALVRLFGAGRSLRWGAGILNWCVVGSHCRDVTSLMRWCPCTLVTPRAEDTRWEKHGLRSSRGHLRPRQRPRLDAPASSTGSWNSSFRRPYSHRLSMAMRGPNKSTRRPRFHMPARSRQRRATQLSGRLPALRTVGSSDDEYPNTSCAWVWIKSDQS